MEKFFKKNKITNVEGCLIFAFQNRYIDEFIIAGENNYQIIKNLNLIKRLDQKVK